jgi:hypothetical protein
MKPGWFERKFTANFQREVQFKAPLLGTTPEDASEIQFVMESAGAAPRRFPS